MPAEVISGLRQPRTTRMESMQAVAAAASAIPTPAVSADASITVYVSKYRRYRVQITAPSSYVGPDGRKVSGGKRLEAQFDEGVYRNDHRDPATRRLVDEALQGNPYFGPFGSGSAAHYWLASDQQARMESARIASALDTLKSLPREQVEQYIATLKQEPTAPLDHVLGDSGDAPARSARSIPPSQ